MHNTNFYELVRKDLHEYLTDLKALANTKPEGLDSICFYVMTEAGKMEDPNVHSGYYCSHIRDLMEYHICRWPKKTSVDYPVPATYGSTSIRDAEFAFWCNRPAGTLWVGEYGALRRELLDFLIERTRPCLSQ